MVEFAYKDSFENHKIEEVIELLVLSNIYDFPSLRFASKQAISKIEINGKNVLLVWKRTVKTDENNIIREAAIVCAAYWNQIVKSKKFNELPREFLLNLCNDALSFFGVG